MSCPTGGRPCRASVRARVGSTAVGRSKARIAAGETLELAFAFSRKGARLLRRVQELEVELSVRVSVVGQSPRTTGRNITIELPPRRTGS